MKTHLVPLYAATVFVLCAGVNSADAQTWQGPHIAGTVGSGIQPDGDNRIVRFDKTLDGDFSDTITTAAGSNAFSPGFCNGAAVNAMPGGGCRRDDRAPDVAARGGTTGRWGARGWRRRRVHTDGPDQQRQRLQHDARLLHSYARARLAWRLPRASWIWIRPLSRLRDRWSCNGTGRARLRDEQRGQHLRRPVWQRKRVGISDRRRVELRLGGRWSFGAEYVMTRLDDRDEFTVRVQGPAPMTNPFILTNPSGTDLRRGDQFDVHAIRFITGYRF